MANYFVDTVLASGADDGSSFDAAKRGTSGMKTGFEVDHAEGTFVIFRRRCAYDEGVVGLNADIAPTADGTSSSPVYFMSWPRAAIANTTLTQADWTNGSTTVDNVVGVSLTRTAHQARWCTAPNGKKYFITQVVDSNTFKIDREYSGTTVTGTDGLFAIDADPFYDYCQAIDDSAWTIKKTDWNADADDLPTIDFNNEAYQLDIAGDHYLYAQGFNFIDSADTSGMLILNSSSKITIRNCLFKQNSSNTPLLVFNGGANSVVDFTIEGSGAGSSQRGLRTTLAGDYLLKNGAIYNCGLCGLQPTGIINLNNVNVGVEIANAAEDVQGSYGGFVKGKDVKLGGTNGYFTYLTSNPAKMVIENFDKILGQHKTYHPYMGTSENIAVTSTNANKKLSDTVLKITPNINLPFSINTPEWYQTIFDGSFELASGSQTIKFWLFNDLGQTLNDTTAKDNIYLRATYVDSYDDTTEYTQVEAFSTEIDILDAADADDWDYLEVTVNPSTASKVRVQLIVSVYDAAGYFLIDPKPVIT